MEKATIKATRRANGGGRILSSKFQQEAKKLPDKNQFSVSYVYTDGRGKVTVLLPHPSILTSCSGRDENHIQFCYTLADVDIEFLAQYLSQNHYLNTVIKPEDYLSLDNYEL